MTEQEKNLLLQDLCARLPYGIKFKANNEEYIREIHYIKDEDVYIREYQNLSYWICTIKPYLRPLSSMTEEEKKEYAEIVVKSQDCSYENNESATTMVNDWYLSKGFDVRGLIPKGLALEAPEGMYNTKEK